MSFSSDVKEELSRQISPARHCQIAEIAAIISMCGSVLISEEDRYSIKIQTENVDVARKCFTLFAKGFKIDTEIAVRKNQYLKKVNSYSVFVQDHEDAVRVLGAVKFLDTYMKTEDEVPLVNPMIVQQSCCKRAFVRGCFLASGSISDPAKFYHFEIVCTSEERAAQLKEIMNRLGVDAKVVSRKKYFVVYIKEGSQIVDMLGLMEANVALMNLENVRILKEMRNNVNRKVNCETANIHKTVSASVKQIEDIKFIKDKIGLSDLAAGLKEIAILRLDYPEATLKELGMMLTPQVGKSGVNHRLRKLSNIAEELKENKEEKVL